MSDIAFAGAPADSRSLSPSPWPKRVGYLSRQPILDRRGGLFGYELRYHDPAEAQNEVNSVDPNGLIDAIALFGAERFAAGHWAFVPCSPHMLLDNVLEGLPSTRLVLEFPDPHETSPKLLGACRRLREAGFRLALTGFEPAGHRDPWIDTVDYVKVEANALQTPGWEYFSALTMVIADHVHTHDVYRTARAAGIGYFQGFYFCRPDLIPNAQIPANRAAHLEILRELFKDPLDLKTLCPLVERDPSLVYRVLRLVNSPFCAVHQSVTSIESAIILLGDAALRRIATLAIHCALNQGQSAELLNMALVRARFCATAAHLCGFHPEEQYLLGMLSLLPPMLGVPMELILGELPLRETIQNALAGIAVKDRCLLAWIEELEQDRIAECNAIAAKFRLDKDQLARLYLSALQDGVNIAAIASAPA